MPDRPAATWILDLDGVVWLAGRAIAGAADAVGALRAGGTRVAFFTNNSGPTVAENREALAAVGIDTEPANVMSSAQAAAQLIAPGSRVAHFGGAGIVEALEERGVALVEVADHPEALVVGRTTDLDYDRLAAAATAIREGARFVATNTDATFPTPDGPVPGAGAIVAFLQVAAGAPPVVAGKPGRPAVDLVHQRVGRADVVVGDRPDTDGRFAEALAARFVLVLSGVTTEADLPVTPSPATVAPNLAAAVRAVFAP
jgi:glycerol 3-phosphatase-2